MGHGGRVELWPKSGWLREKMRAAPPPSPCPLLLTLLVTRLVWGSQQQQQQILMPGSTLPHQLQPASTTLQAPPCWLFTNTVVIFRSVLLTTQLLFIYFCVKGIGSRQMLFTHSTMDTEFMTFSKKHRESADLWNINTGIL